MGILTASCLFTSLLATGIVITDQATDEAPPLGPDGLTVASVALHVDLEGELPLADLLTSFSQVTGMQVVTSPSVRERVDQTRFAGFGDGLILPPAELQGFVEGLLTREGYRLALTHPGRVPVLTLLDARNAQPFGDSPWLHIAVEDVVHFMDNPALLVEAVVPCSALDARQIANSMRMLTSPPWSQLISLGSGDAIFVRGTGTEVARLIDSVQRTDRLAVERNRALQQAQAAAQVPLEAPQAAAAATSGGGGQARGPQGEAHPAPVTTVPTVTGERPQLETRFYELEKDLFSVTDVVRELTYNRHSAESSGRVWYRAENGNDMPWPRPNFSFLKPHDRQDRSAGGQLIIQGTGEDLDWVEGTLHMVMKLSASEA